MRLRKIKITVFGIIAAFMCCMVLPSCGSMHSYWGVENDYYSDGHSPQAPEAAKTSQKA